MTQLDTIGNRTQVPIPDSPARSSRLEELFLKDDFLRTVLIGVAGGFGLSTLVILISLELTTLRAPIAGQLGAWWFLVPASTAIGFTLWTFMILRIRRHRVRELLRSAAFRNDAGAGADLREAGGTDIEEPDSNEDWFSS